MRFYLHIMLQNKHTTVFAGPYTFLQMSFSKGYELRCSSIIQTVYLCTLIKQNTTIHKIMFQNNYKFYN